MKLRTLALALALACGTTVMADAKTRTAHRVSVKRGRKYNSRAHGVRARKSRAVVKSHH